MPAPRFRLRAVKGETGRLPRLAAAIAAALILFTFGGGISAAPSTPAHAFIFDGLCEESSTDGPGISRTQIYPGIAQFGAQLVSAPSAPGVLNAVDTASGDSLDLTRPFKDQTSKFGAVTPYEYYGTAGLGWTTGNYAGMDSGCMVGVTRAAGQLVSNLLWTVTLFVGALGLSLYAAATSLDFFTPMLSFVDAMLTGNPAVPGDQGLFGSLYLTYLVPVLVLGAAGLIWQGVMRRRGSETLQRTLWMLGATTGAIIFLTNPGVIAGTVNSTVVQIQNGLITSITAASTGNVDVQGTIGAPGDQTSTAGAGSLCALSDGAFDGQRRTLLCQQWYTFMYTPWLIGQFGSPDADTTKTAAGSPGVNIPGQEERFGLGLTHLDAVAVNHDAQIAARSGEGADTTGRVVDQWAAVIDTVKTSGNPSIWSGADIPHRLTTALLAFLAMGFGAGPMIWLTMLLLMYQLATIMLLLMAPLFFLAGAHPGTGRRVGLGWLEMILSIQIKRVVTVGVLSILLAVITLVQRATETWLLQVLMIAMVSVMVLVMRGKIVDKFATISIGGDQSLLTEGAGAMKSAGSKATNMLGSAAGIPGTAIGAPLAFAGGMALTAGVGGFKKLLARPAQEQSNLSPAGATGSGGAQVVQALSPRALPPGAQQGSATTSVTGPGPGRVKSEAQLAAAATKSARASVKHRNTQALTALRDATAQHKNAKVNASECKRSVAVARTALHDVIADPGALAASVVGAQDVLQEAVVAQNVAATDLENAAVQLAAAGRRRAQITAETITELAALTKDTKNMTTVPSNVNAAAIHALELATGHRAGYPFDASEVDQSAPAPERGR